MTYFNTEYKRASIATILTELFKFVSEYFIVYRHVDTHLLSLIIYIMSICIHYTLDIFIAKSFDSSQDKVSWYINSFVNTNFSKYIVFTILHFIISQNILNYLKALFDKYKIVGTYRDLSSRLLVNMFLFALYGYFLKFKWAYSDNNDQTITMIVLSWCTISMMLYTLSNTVKP